MSRPVARSRLLLAAAALVLLAGCTGDDAAQGPGPVPPTTSEGGTAGTPAPGKTATPATRPVRPPKVGACYRLTPAELARPTSEAPAVRCSKAHTARTIAVGQLDLVVGGHAIGVDSDRAQAQQAQACPERLRGYLGGDQRARDLSRFRVVWFSADVTQADLGADWYRCDLVAFAGEDSLLPLPRGEDLRGVLDDPAALDRFGTCGTAAPDAQGFERVACAQPHSWVAIDTIPIEGGEQYPGAEAVRDAGDDTCADRVREVNDFVLEFTYGWEWPTRAQWESGQRYGLCWAPDELAP